MKDCIFCKIVSGEIPSGKVYENTNVLAFNDIAPVAPVHVVVIPKKHYTSLMDIPANESDILRDLFMSVQHVAELKGIAKKGFRTVINTGKEGGQIINHLHIHVFGGRNLKMELE